MTFRSAEHEVHEGSDAEAETCAPDPIKRQMRADIDARGHD